MLSLLITALLVLARVHGTWTSSTPNKLEQEILANRLKAAAEQQQATAPPLSPQNASSSGGRSSSRNSPVFVAILVFTAPGRRAHRDAVAETWGGDAGYLTHARRPSLKIHACARARAQDGERTGRRAI